MQDVADGEAVGRHLFLRLHRVAAIDEQRRGIREDHGRAGRTGEAGQPAQPLFSGRDVLALVRVRPRDDEPGEPTPLQLNAQAVEPAGHIVAVGGHRCR